MEAKQLKLTFLLAVLMSIVGAKAFAHDIEVKNADGKTIYYTYMNNETELAVSYRGSSYSSYSKEYSGVVNIPESVTYNGTIYPVTSIGELAFFYCSGLTSVTIPNSVTSIGGSAFSLCIGLTSVTIGNSVTGIGSRAFSNCSSLTSITIPNSVTGIGSGAFSDCTGLTSVTIPNSVTSIGESAFSGCSSLTEINVDENNTAYSSIDGVLFNKSQTELILYPRRKQGTYTIPNSVTSIGGSAFSLCIGLTSVTIPNSVTSIGDRAFSGCTGLTSVTIGNSVTSIGEMAFYGCSSLTEINVDENNTAYSSIDGVLFNKSQTKLIRYPGGKQGAYTIPNSVTSIGYEAFYDCNKLTSVTIPNSVTSIGTRAFSGCRGLTSVTIPNSVTSIGSRAFSNCSSLTSITIPNSVTSIGYLAFYGGLTEINVDENNTAYSSIDGVLFNKSQTELVLCPTRKQGAYTIPNSVTSIGYEAFFGCYKLTSVTIPNSVTSIGYEAFRNCTGLTSVTIPNSVTSIGQNAFEFCYGLTSVTIPNSVTSIGKNAFGDCSGLTDIYCHIEEPLTIASNVFNNVPRNTCTLHVPIGSKVKYQAADVWKSFLNTVEDLPGRLTQTITWAQSLSSVVGLGCEIELNAVASTGLPITYTIKSGNDYATLITSGEKTFLRGVKAGTVVVEAKQVGNNEYLPVNVEKVFTIIEKLVQEITWNQEIEAVVGDSLILSATSSSGLPVAYRALDEDYCSKMEIKQNAEGQYVVHFSNRAPSIIEAYQEGNDTYNAAEPVRKYYNTLNSSEINGLMCIDGIYYKYTDNTCTALKIVRGFKQYEGNMIFPAVVNGLPVTNMESDATYICPIITSIEFEEGHSRIEGIHYDMALEKLILPSTTTYIDYLVLFCCPKLKDVYLYATTPPEVSSYCDYDQWTEGEGKTLYVPRGTKSAYENADFWKHFTIVEIDVPTGIVSIDNSQLTIDNDVWFTINGTRLNGKPTKAGIYIVKGKKVIIK